MHNLQKTIRYGILSAFGVILVGICMMYAAKTVMAEEKIQITNFARIFYIPAIAAETGSEKETIQEKLRAVTVKAYCADGSTRELFINWDLTPVNPQRTGVSKIQGKPSVPEDLSVSGETSLPVYTTQVSIQNPGQPEIEIYSCMKSSGIFVFPWISGLDTEHMTAWLRKEGSSWTDLTESGYARCMDDGLYLANSAMTVGNAYELAISGNGFQTRILSFIYKSASVLDIRNYRIGAISGIATPDKKIRSVEENRTRMNERCMAFALEMGGNVQTIRDTLTKDIILFGSTAEAYENTAENPAQAMHAVWDISEINTGKPGVYKITGEFQAPEGYTLAENLKLPEMTAYISIQNPDAPEINTYYMPEVHQIVFPMVLKNILDCNPEVWIKENSQSWEKLGGIRGELKDTGICLFRNALKPGNQYQLCLTWENGSTGIYSFDFGKDFITNENWIQRNFADRDGREFPDLSLETTITPELELTSESGREVDTVTHPSGDESQNTGGNGSGKKVTEIVTEKWTIISGKRLNFILKYMGNVSFEKDGISLQIPQPVAQNWKVKEEQTIQTMVQKTSDQTYEIKIYKGAQEITDISGSQVVLPVKEVFPEEIPETINVTNAEGERIKTSLDKNQDLLTIRTDKTGTFHINGQKENIQGKPIAAAAMAVITGLTVGIRNRSGKRGGRHREKK